MSRKNNDEGVALISVLLLLSALGVLTAAAIAAGLYLNWEVAGSEKRARDFYRAESALNRTVYLLKMDVASYPDRTLGEVDYGSRFLAERMMADGTFRTCTVADGGVTLTVELTDAAGRFSLEPFSTLAERLAARRNRALIGTMPDLDQERRFGVFQARLADAFDADSFRSLDGMEQPEYVRAQLPNLPRNGDWQFREEILQVPGAAEFFHSSGNGLLDTVNLIAPAGLPALPGGVRLYSSTLDDIVEALDMNDRERDRLDAALTAWRSARIKLSKTLDRELYSKITVSDQVVNRESGIYQLEIGDGKSVKLNATFSLNRGPVAFLEFYEYVF